MRQLLIACALLLGGTAVHAAPRQSHADEDVTFRSGSITIAGTLSLPSGRGPFPAVVLLSGSGPQDRDSELAGFRPFKLIAAAFVERGLAVLRCDDRGVGGSTGNLADATLEDFADDALAAVAVLRGRARLTGRGSACRRQVAGALRLRRGRQLGRRERPADRHHLVLRRLETALTEARNQQVTVRVYPEANHLFMPAVTGQLAEYATLPKVFVAPLLDDMATWIAKR